MNLQLVIGTNAAASFASLGIKGASLVEELDGNVHLTLDCAGSISDPYIIAPFQRCVLIVDGTIRFVGWMDEAPRKATANSEYIQYKLNGPARWLARTMFVQNFGGIVFVAGRSNQAAQQSVLTWKQALQDVLNDGGMSAYFTWNNTNWPQVYNIPSRPRSDITCYDALRTLLSYSPMTYLRWTWGATAASLPTLFVGDINDSIDRTLNASTINLSEASINPRYDLLVSTIIVTYMRDNALAATQTSTITTDADTLGANRTETYTFDTSSALNVPTAGLANAIKRFRGRLHVDGSATREGIDWTDEVGQTWGFAGTKFQQLASMRTILNTVERDLFREQTQLSFGVMPSQSIYEVYNRSDFDRGGVTPISMPSYTGTSKTAPFTPSNGYSSGTSGSVDISATQLTSTQAASFREIQRCDGLKAKVLMTNWYT